MDHIQDFALSTHMISNECMIYHMKVYIVSYDLGQNFFSKSKIHILPNYEQKDFQTAIVVYRVFVIFTNMSLDLKKTL